MVAGMTGVGIARSVNSRRVSLPVMAVASGRWPFMRWHCHWPEAPSVGDDELVIVNEGTRDRRVASWGSRGCSARPGGRI
jgi:hypothetical protein